MIEHVLILFENTFYHCINVYHPITKDHKRILLNDMTREISIE